jgi:DNA-binding HxlR family transcriptional regulator
LRKTSFADMQCSLARGLDRMGDWWSPLIIRDLYLGVVRFDELVEDLGISRNLLTRRLNALVARKLVVRHAYRRRPVRYEYTLSPAGKDLIPVILALTSWGDRWAQPREGAPLEFVHDSCGKKFQPHIKCSICGGAIEADNVKVVAGPGGAAKRGTRVLARRLQSVTASG